VDKGALNDLIHCGWLLGEGTAATKGGIQDPWWWEAKCAMAQWHSWLQSLYWWGLTGKCATVPLAYFI